MIEFWINHPVASGQPVSLLRKLAYELGCWLQWKGQQLERWALDPDDDIPF